MKSLAPAASNPHYQLMLLELRGISKSYPGPDGSEEIAVLDQVDLSIDKGDAVAVVGPSGSGKSTLLNLIGTLDTPSQGEILFEGRSLAELSELEIAAYRNRSVGFIFQLHHLLPQCSVEENILLPTLARPEKGERSNFRERARTLLERVGLSGRRNHRPGQLSGGERQRVAVARALINDPKLLLADEPTGSLDQSNASKLFDLLYSLNQEEGLTLIVVTHASDLADRLPRILKLTDGRLVEETG